MKCARETFLNLPADKKNAVVDAAIAEFTAHGYVGASTNRIVRALGISKGSLFQYFSSKEDLYCYLIYSAVMKLLARLDPLMTGLSPDILERVRRFSDLALDIYLEEPALFRFILTINQTSFVILQARLMEEFSTEIARFYQVFFTGLDQSSFRLPLKDTISAIMWMIAGLKAEMMQGLDSGMKISDFKADFMNRIDLALDILSGGIFKNGGGS